MKYVQANGGYLVFFTDYARLVANVPLLFGCSRCLHFRYSFVFETRKKYLWLITALYFGSAALFLFTGSRMDMFSLILTLWYVARVKRPGRLRLLPTAMAAILLVLVSNAIQAIRFEETDELANVVPKLALFVKEQGISLNVTEVSIKYRDMFAPYIPQYALREVMSKFVSSDVTNYRRGQQFSLDVPLFLNPSLFAAGLGSGGTYLAQGYIAGGVAGVVVLSFIVGSGLRQLQALTRKAATLFFVALILPDIVMLPRGGVLVWLSTIIRSALVGLVLVAGWFVFTLISSIGKKPPYRASLSIPA